MPFLNPQSIKIDPSLGVIDQGVIDLKAPPESTDSPDDPRMPAAIGITKPMKPKRAVFVRGAGSTLAEQLGTQQATGIQAPVLEETRPSQPIEVPERIAPQVSRNLSADAMASLLTPKFREFPVQEKPKEEVVPANIEIPSPVESAPALSIKADLKDLVLRYIQKVGPEEAAKFFGKPAMLIHNWVNGKHEPPLAAAQAILDKSPKAREHYLKVAERVYIDFESGEGSFSRDHTREDIPVDLCVVTNKDFPPYVHWVFVTATAQYGLGEKMMVDAPLVRARNLVADMFLSGKATWSIWLDYDILPTTGNGAWWRAVTRDLGNSATVNDATASYDFIKRFLSHNKPYVGGVYTTRRKGGPLVTQPDLHPRGQKDIISSDATRKNRAQGLYGPVDWLAIGFSCIHRIVFETIRKQNPGKIPKTPGEPYPYFNEEGCEGEDFVFCERARKAGFQLYLDAELFAGHIGRYCFLPGESAYNGPVDFRNAQA